MPITFMKLPSFERLNELLTYDPDSGDLRWKVHRSNVKAGSIAGYIRTNKNGRRDWKIMIDGKLYYSSRVIWDMHHHVDPGGKTIDHVDQNPLNNRIANLRLATAHEQNMNTKRTSPSMAARYTGLAVASHKNDKQRPRWRGEIKISGHNYAFGSAAVNSIDDPAPQWLIDRANRIFAMRDNSAITDEDLIKEIGIIKTSEDSCSR